MVISFGEDHIGAQPRRGHGSCRPGGSAADHQYIGMGKDWNIPRGLGDVAQIRALTTRKFHTCIKDAFVG